MGLFDRFMSKKDAPSEASSDPNAPTPPAGGTPSSEIPPQPTSSSPINMDEANKFINNASQAVNDSAKSFVESAKPLGESLKPIGQSLIADLSSAGRDIGNALQNIGAPSSSPTSSSAPPPEQPYPSPEAAPAAAPPTSAPEATVPLQKTVEPTPAYTPPPVAPTSPPSEATFVPPPAQTEEFSSPFAAPTAPITPQNDDALPLPDTFDPFAASADTASTTTPDSTTSESNAYNASVLDEAIFSPAISPATVPLSGTPTPTAPSDTLDEEGNLEEYHEPLPSLAPSPLTSGTALAILSGDGSIVDLTVTEVLSPRATINCYRAQNTAGTTLLLREAVQHTEGAAQLERENSARRAINSPQIPPPVAYGTVEERVYLADTTGESEKTFASQLQENASLADLISTLTQTSAAISALHRAGFLHGAIRPEAIILGKPVRLSSFASLSPIGQKSDSPSSYAGYGAPEIIAGETLDARTDIYSVGALLHRIVTGSGVSETGWDATTFTPEILLPGVPQILAKTLGPAPTRYSDMSALHRDLVRLRARLRPLARHESVGETTIGLEWGRTTNQDAWGELRGHTQGEDGAVEWTAWVVSDGMGGMASGEVASQVSVGAVLKEAATWSLGGTTIAEAEQAQLVKSWTREANRQAVDAMNHIGARGGCTLVCGLVVDKRLTLAHVGDCRAYLWRGGELTQLTRDHSYVMSLVLQGEITRDQMRDHPDRSKITRSLGDRHPMPDYFVDGLEVEMKTPSIELRNGDVFLAFSDGVWEPVLEDAMVGILSSAPSIAEAAHQLVEAAMREGGPDNATVYIFKMGEAAPVVVAQNATP